MYKRLSIIIPRYKETEHDISPLLSSIENQLDIDTSSVEVLICNDGVDPFSGEFLDGFGIEIKQVNRTENGGAGMARQSAMDMAHGEYLFFCDADDILYSVLSLSKILREADNTGADILVTDILEEVLLPDGTNTYIKHEGTSGCYPPGKLFRSQFLREHNIRFNAKFRVHEDAYFALVAFSEARMARYMPEITYVWKCNHKSVTRNHGGAFNYVNAPVYIDAVTTAWKEIEPLCPEKMGEYVTQLIYYHFFMLQRADWMQPNNAEYKAHAEAALREKVTPYLHYYNSTSTTLKAQEYNAERERSFAGCVETETLQEWISRVFSKD